MLTKRASLISPLLPAFLQKKHFLLFINVERGWNKVYSVASRRTTHGVINLSLPLMTSRRGIALTACASTHFLQRFVENWNVWTGISFVFIRKSCKPCKNLGPLISAWKRAFFLTVYFCNWPKLSSIALQLHSRPAIKSTHTHRDADGFKHVITAMRLSISVFL